MTMNVKSPVLRTSMIGLLGAVVMIGCGDDYVESVSFSGRALCVETFDGPGNFEVRDMGSGEVFNNPPTVNLTEGTTSTEFDFEDLEAGERSVISLCSDEAVDETVDSEVSTTTSDVTTSTTTTDETTTSVNRATPTTQVSAIAGTTTVARGTGTSPTTMTTMPSYGATTTSYAPPSGPPTGNWIRNDSRCSWRGASSCGVYSGGNGQWEEVGPSGSSGSTFTPIAGTSGQIAFNLYAGNSIQNCDWNGTGECGWYFTGTPGTLTMGPTG